MTVTGKLITRHIEQPRFSVAGVIGSGKTSTARAKITRAISLGVIQRLIIFTPKPWDFDGFVEETVYSAEELDDYLDDIRPNWPFSVAYKPEDRPRNLALAHVCRWAMFLENCTICADELHDAAHHSNVQRDTVICVKEGRDPNVGFIGISQGLFDIAPAVRRELNAFERYIMLLTESEDGKVVNRIRDNLFDIVKFLPRLHGVRITPYDIEPRRFAVDPRGGALLVAPDGTPLSW